MSSWCCVESDTGESIDAIHSTGHIAGHLTLAFIMAMMNACQDLESGESGLNDKWLQQFYEIAGDKACSIARVLEGATIHSGWLYNQNDYDRYLSESNDETPLSRESFLSTAQHYQDAWTTVDDLANAVSQLIDILTSPTLPDDPIYVPKLTALDLKAVREALALSKQHGASKARLSFD